MAGYQHFRGPCCLYLLGEVNGAGKGGTNIHTGSVTGGTVCVGQYEVVKERDTNGRKGVRWFTRMVTTSTKGQVESSPH
jgi:hypothetical protein